MRIDDGGRVIWSASDLKRAADCEFAWLRDIDARLGRIGAVVEEDDAMMQRAIRMGLDHEHRVLAGYHAQYPGEVVEIPDVTRAAESERAAAVEYTLEVLRDESAKVLYQAAFRSDDFIGYADFLVRTDEGWLVQDTKLARTARVSALMQLAAYVDRLQVAGIRTAPTVELILGNGEISTHAVDDILPVFLLRRERLRSIIASRNVSAGIDVPAIAWEDVPGDLDIVACGRCATCEGEVIAHHDLLLVAGMRPTQRRCLREAGITTIKQLSLASPVVPDGLDIPADVFANLRTQAMLQMISPAGIPSLDSEAPEHPVPVYEVVLRSALSLVPAPDAGDMFFDFEGDPLHAESGSDWWGLDYLFGWVDQHDTYTALWAHDFAAERVALEQFLTAVSLVREQHPNMHIYHYAPYEPTHLEAMAARHGFGEKEVANLIAQGVFVDLYPIIKRAVRVGSRSYSIKKLEPLYMGDEVRTADVQKGDESIERYVEAAAFLDAGDTERARPILDDLADYNRYDCVSTRRLRNWLLERAAEAGVQPGPSIEAEIVRTEPSLQAVALQNHAVALATARRDPDGERESDETALRIAAAALDYHAREDRAYWASHFLRLREPLSSWSQSRDVLSVDAPRSHVTEDWATTERERVPKRTIRLRGQLSPGSSLRPGSDVYAIYERPVPFPAVKSARWINVTTNAKLVEVLDDGYIVQERGFEDAPFQVLPIAIVPGPPPPTKNIQARIELWARGVVATAPDLPLDASSDILLRRPPRTRSGRLSASATDRVGAIVDSVRDLQQSYVAVQGPPGTGKTYVGSHVVARLVSEFGYKVGVVAQSHEVVDNLLERVVLAGLPIDRVGKATADRDAEDERFTPVLRRDIARFRAEHDDHGYVIGGTAWDFCNDQRTPAGSLDLLVIDEAGQYSLANTIACATAAENLLLLGDPQQLPQVSQGTHPEPVDTSALGWIMDDSDVIGPEFGYFLEQSWRMRPEVAAVVSELSYEGQLKAAPEASGRWIEGIEPGVRGVPVNHRGDTSHSGDEAAVVVELVQNVVGRMWQADDDVVPRPLTPGDVIVVTPYNAQREVVSDALVAAGFDEVRVGTVDKFQGKEAAVAIMSLAASSARDAPRGLEFLLLQNRLNVAISRAQVAAYVVYSPGVLEDLPRTAPGVARLSAFARMVDAIPKS